MLARFLCLTLALLLCAPTHAAPRALDPVPASQDLWILTDVASQSTTVIGMHVGPTPQVFLSLQSAPLKPFQAIDVLPGRKLSLLRGGAYASFNALQIRDAFTGVALHQSLLSTWQLNRMCALPDGTFVNSQSKFANANLFHVDREGTLLESTPSPFNGLDDHDVDAHGNIWITREASQLTWLYTPDFANQLGQVSKGGLRVAVAPDGTLWLLRPHPHDLVHVSTSGFTLGTIALPTLADPAALDVDRHGTVWVSGHGADRVEHYAPDGTHLSTVLLPGPVGVQDLVVR